jgi:hypothetical protein
MGEYTKFTVLRCCLLNIQFIVQYALTQLTDFRFNFEPNVRALSNIILTIATR